MPKELAEWLRPRLLEERFTQAEIDARLDGMKFSFEPADIVNSVMSFGSPTPVEVVVSGAVLADDEAYAKQLERQLRQIGPLRDLQIAQSLDYPTVAVRLDRELAEALGMPGADRPEFELTMPVEALASTLKRAREEARIGFADDLKQVPTETEEERRARFLRAEQTCDELLARLGHQEEAPA